MSAPDVRDAEIATLRAINANLSLLLTEAKESGKAARRLAREAMKANGVVGAHVVLKASEKGLRLVVCAPPAENEEALAAAIGRAMESGLSVLRAGEPAGHVGVSES